MLSITRQENPQFFGTKYCWSPLWRVKAVEIRTLHLKETRHEANHSNRALHRRRVCQHRPGNGAGSFRPAAVPFDFTVADKLLPTGTYTITPEASGVIMIENRDKHIAVLSQTSYDSHESRKGGQLVFDKYGNQYFLSEILCQTAAMNVNVAPSKRRSVHALSKRRSTTQPGYVQRSNWD